MVRESENGQRTNAMHSLYDGLLIFIPTGLSVLFLLWALWHFFRAADKR